MLSRSGRLLAITSLAFLVIGGTATSQAADGGIWHVAKRSGSVWVTRRGVEFVSLGNDTALAPGDEIRTGRNGRVLLTRGQERILISPNSSIGIPVKSADGYPTTITERAGSILLEVDKKRVRHFEVETPYLAAVVKGTHFRVTVSKVGGRVDVLRGQVLVTDFKSGQNVLVLPGQSARDFARGRAGLSMSGTGTFSPIHQGKPRSSGVRALLIPKDGLHRPHLASNDLKDRTRGSDALARADTHSASETANGTVRIRAALGEVKLDFNKVTHGLAHGFNPSQARAPSRGEVASGTNSAVSTTNAGDNGSANGLGNGGGNGNGIGNGGSNGNGLGNGGGNGSGLGNGGGNGNGVGIGNGQGNGLANGLVNGVGNALGKGKGHGKGG
jgi:FecR protein